MVRFGCGKVGVVQTGRQSEASIDIGRHRYR